MAKALSAISPASITVISRVPGRFTPSWNADSNMGGRLLADCAAPCNSRRRSNRGRPCMHDAIDAAACSGAAARLAAAMTAAARPASPAAAAGELTPMTLPPPIGRAERLARLAKARDADAAPTASARSSSSPGRASIISPASNGGGRERLTAAVIPARGRPDHRHALLRKALASRRAWRSRPRSAPGTRTRSRSSWSPTSSQERERRGRSRSASRRPIASSSSTGCSSSCRGVRVVSANPVVRALRMIKTPAELALMQAAADITIAALRATPARRRARAWRRADIDALIAAATAGARRRL